MSLVSTELIHFPLQPPVASERPLISPLSDELKVFNENFDQWNQSNPGMYAVIQGQTVLKLFSECKEAFMAGLESFTSRRRFLVKQIAKEPLHFIF